MLEVGGPFQLPPKGVLLGIATGSFETGITPGLIVSKTRNQMTN